MYEKHENRGYVVQRLFSYNVIDTESLLVCRLTTSLTRIGYSLISVIFLISTIFHRASFVLAQFIAETKRGRVRDTDQAPGNGFPYKGSGN